MTGYHTRWARPEDVADDPERIAIREALAFAPGLASPAVKGRCSRQPVPVVPPSTPGFRGLR